MLGTQSYFFFHALDHAELQDQQWNRSQKRNCDKKLVPQLHSG